MRSHKLFGTALGLLLLSSTASATIQLTLQSGSTTIVVNDGGANDSNSGVGIITYIGAVGHWNFNVTTGYSGSNPIIGLTSFNNLNTLPGTGADALTLEFSGTDFVLGSAATFSAAIGGTLGNGHSLTYATYLNTNNALNATQTAIGAPLTFTPGAFSGTTTGGFVSGGQTFSLTEIVTITATAKGATSFNATIDAATPEPATMGMLGTVLLFTAGALRRKLHRTVS